MLKCCGKLPTNPRYATDKTLRTINFTADNVEKIITSLNLNKTHGHDNTSLRMLKICGIPFVNLQSQFLNTFLPLTCFRVNRKKAILSLVTKKANNITLKLIFRFLYFLSVENFLKDSNLMKCLVFFLLTIF